MPLIADHDNGIAGRISIDTLQEGPRGTAAATPVAIADVQEQLREPRRSAPSFGAAEACCLQAVVETAADVVAADAAIGTAYDDMLTFCEEHPDPKLLEWVVSLGQAMGLLPTSTASITACAVEFPFATAALAATAAGRAVAALVAVTPSESPSAAVAPRGVGRVA